MECYVTGVVSLMLPKLSKIISQKYTMPEITFMVRVSSMALGTRTKFQLEIRIRSRISAMHIFESSETLVKQPPGHLVDIKGESTMAEDLFGCKTAVGGLTSLVLSFEMMTLQLQATVFEMQICMVWSSSVKVWIIVALSFLSLHYAIFCYNNMDLLPQTSTTDVKHDNCQYHWLCFINQCSTWTFLNICPKFHFENVQTSNIQS